MKELFIHPLAKALNLKLEKADTLDGYLEQILPRIEYSSDTLYESELYTNLRWLEITDGRAEMILRIFSLDKMIDKSVASLDPFKYTHSVNGNVTYGTWTLLKGKALVLEHDISRELFDLVFLNEEFMVLQKHGHKPNNNVSRYIFLTREELADGLSWRQNAEELYNVYRHNLASIVLVVLLGFIVLLVAVLTFL